MTAYDPGNIFRQDHPGRDPVAQGLRRRRRPGDDGHLPPVPGPYLVIPKAPSRNLYDADPTVLAKAIGHVQRVANAVHQALSPDGIRIAQFNEAPAGQSVFHLHFHIIPVYEGVPVGRHGDSGKADDAELAEQARAIAAHLK